MTVRRHSSFETMGLGEMFGRSSLCWQRHQLRTGGQHTGSYRDGNICGWSSSQSLVAIEAPWRNCLLSLKQPTKPACLDVPGRKVHHLNEISLCMERVVGQRVAERQPDRQTASRQIPSFAYGTTPSGLLATSRRTTGQHLSCNAAVGARMKPGSNNSLCS